MQCIWIDKETEVIISIDAANAFNTLSRKATLYNVHIVSSGVPTSLKNLRPPLLVNYPLLFQFMSTPPFLDIFYRLQCQILPTFLGVINQVFFMQNGMLSC